MTLVSTIIPKAAFQIITLINLHGFPCHNFYERSITKSSQLGRVGGPHSGHLCPQGAHLSSGDTSVLGGTSVLEGVSVLGGTSVLRGTPVLRGT